LRNLLVTCEIGTKCRYSIDHARLAISVNMFSCTVSDILPLVYEYNMYLAGASVIRITWNASYVKSNIDIGHISIDSNRYPSFSSRSYENFGFQFHPFPILHLQSFP